MSTDKNTRPKTAAADYRLIRKYQREAAKAGFTNPFIRKIQNADCNKTLYENRITTGNCIDGQIITLDAVRKWCGTGGVSAIPRGSKEPYPIPFIEIRFQGIRRFALGRTSHNEGDGYYLAGDLNAGFSKEYRGCLNGYYYLLINERIFIGYDVG